MMLFYAVFLLLIVLFPYASCTMPDICDGLLFKRV